MSIVSSLVVIAPQEIDPQLYIEQLEHQLAMAEIERDALCAENEMLRVDLEVVRSRYHGLAAILSEQLPPLEECEG